MDSDITVMKSSKCSLLGLVMCLRLLLILFPREMLLQKMGLVRQSGYLKNGKQRGLVVCIISGLNILPHFIPILLVKYRLS